MPHVWAHGALLVPSMCMLCVIILLFKKFE